MPSCRCQQEVERVCYAALPLVFDNIRKHGECTVDHAQAEVVPYSIVICLAFNIFNT